MIDGERERVREREREAETQAEGEAGSTQGARYGTQSQDSRIMPWAEGRHQTTELLRDPLLIFLRLVLNIEPGILLASNKC